MIKERNGLITNSTRWLIIIILSGVFLFSAFGKIAHPDAFAFSVFRYHLLPHELVNIFALWLSWTELAVALVLLFVPRWRIAAYSLMLLMLLTFSVSIATMLFQGNDMSCGCFSSSPLALSLGFLSILRNLALCILAMAGIYLDFCVKR